MSTENNTDPAVPNLHVAPKGKKKKWPFVAGGIALLVIVGSCSANSGKNDAAPATPSSQSQEAPKAETPAKAEPALGVPFTVDQGNGNVAQVTILSAEHKTDLGTAYSIAPKNGSYLVLDVLWETAKGTTNANPMYFTAKDADGRKADITIHGDGTLGSGEVPVGDKMRGFVILDTTPGKQTVIVTNVLLQEKVRLTVG